MVRNAAVVMLIAGLTCPAIADDYNEAEKSAAFMAAVAVCRANVSQEMKRAMYAKMLRVYETPSQTNYTINREVSSLNKMMASDREAMCMALAERIKSTEQP